MVYSGGVCSFVQAAAICALALNALPSVQAKNVISKQCVASDGDKSYGVYAIKDESCAKNGGLGCFGKVCRFCKVLDTPKSSHLNTCLSYGVAFTSTTPVTVTQGPCEVASGDVAAGISAVKDSGCLNGGLGCFNDHCRYCKVEETSRSAGFIACSSIDSSYSAPVSITKAPATAAPTAAPTAATNLPTIPVPTAFTPVTDTFTTAPTVTASIMPSPTTEAPVSTTELPVPSGSPTTNSPVAFTDEPSLTTDAPFISTGGSTSTASTTDAPVVSTDDPLLTTDAPDIPTEVPVSTTEAPIVTSETPAPNVACTLVASAEDVGFGISVGTDPSCSAGGVGCIDEICRFCKVTTSMQSAAYADCALFNNGSRPSETPLSDATDAPIEAPTETPSAEVPNAAVGDTDAPSEVPIETPSATTEVPIATSDASNSPSEIPLETPTATTKTPVTDQPSEIPSETPSGTTEAPNAAVDDTNASHEVPIETPSATTVVPIATSDASNSPSEIPSETPAATTETPTTDSPSEIPSGTPSGTAETPTAATETPVATTNTPSATPVADTPDVTTETPVAEPPAVTETPTISTGSPIVSQDTCGITAAEGDIVVGIHIATDTTCSAGGIGCINDLCRFCKVQNTTQSAEFVDCSSLVGFSSDSAAPVDVVTTLPGSTTPPGSTTTSPGSTTSTSSATCDLAASNGDAAVGIRIITDPSCSVGGAGCISDVCRFCKVITSLQSEAFIDCAAVGGYTPETEAPVTTTTAVPSSLATCTQVASDGDLAVGVDITTDATCSIGGSGCIDDVCRFCQTTVTPQSAEFVTCASIAAYSPRTEAPVDVTTSTPSHSNTNAPVTQSDCSLVVSAGDSAVGISITGDATCAVGGIGCIDNVCRFCKVETTVQSAAFIDCTSIAAFALVPDVSVDTATPPTGPTSPTTDNPTTSTPAATCSLVVSERDAAVGIDIIADWACQFGGIGCIDGGCRFCKKETTEKSVAFIDCPATTVAGTPTPVDLTPEPISTNVSGSDAPADTNEPVDVTKAPATATPTETPGDDFVTKSPDITSDTSGDSSSNTGTDNNVSDAPTGTPSVTTGGSLASDGNDTTAPTRTEAPTTDVDTSDLLTEAPQTTTEPPVSTNDIDDSGDWEGPDEGSDSDSTYFDLEGSLDDI
ncbi:mucin-like protein [Phytophthora infestans T30-4]|uniref:Mucin-like protein n=1 Tax=Phytophthora infestans (strain T30-4) TaxID=403677 RepID=D0NS53_PHYIT|nr:mucin-like protein [Phytophthora infestans T30-4]EEY63594.1 mucin-like protein [Phytophthora infestans T30-4]|eukprot:XP_002898181.1 mucin-like protein [Phytophthora infestans T30-4]